MNKRFRDEDHPLLSSIIDRIQSSIKCPKFDQYSSLIDIDTWDNIKTRMPHNRHIAEAGFGFCISNYFELGEFKRLIVVNMDNCNRVNFNEREIASIVYHELGHLLNMPALVEVPTMMHCFLNGIEYSKELEDRTHLDNSMQMEVYADSYACQFGFGEDLISTFYKQNQHFDQKIGYFETRVEKIKEGVVFQGSVTPINQNRW